MKPKVHKEMFLRRVLEQQHQFGIELQTGGRSLGWAQPRTDYYHEDEPFGLAVHGLGFNSAGLRIDSPVFVDESGAWWPTRLTEALSCFVMVERLADHSLASLCVFPCGFEVPADAEQTRRDVHFEDDNGAEEIYFNTDATVVANTPSPWLERECLGTSTTTELVVRLEVQGKRAAEADAAAQAAQEAREAGAEVGEAFAAGRAAAKAVGPEDDGSGWILSGLRIFFYWRDDTLEEDYPATPKDMGAVLIGSTLEWI